MGRISMGRLGFTGGRKKLLAIGDAVPDFELADHQGARRRLSSFRGRRVILSFHGFPVCPTCAFDADRLRMLALMFGRAGVVALCVFETVPPVVTKYCSRPSGGTGGMCTLIDEKGAVSRTFAGSRTAGASVVAMGRKKLKHDSGVPDGSCENRTKHLPAHFLIDEDGVIVDMYRAETTSDHIPFERIEAFIPEQRRCRCNKKDCIFPRCRENYNQIRREASNMLFSGAMRRLSKSIPCSIGRHLGGRQPGARHLRQTVCR